MPDQNVLLQRGPSLLWCHQYGISLHTLFLGRNFAIATFSNFGLFWDRFEWYTAFFTYFSVWKATVDDLELTECLCKAEDSATSQKRCRTNAPGAFRCAVWTCYHSWAALTKRACQHCEVESCSQREPLTFKFKTRMTSRVHKRGPERKNLKREQEDLFKFFCWKMAILHLLQAFHWPDIYHPKVCKVLFRWA